LAAAAAVAGAPSREGSVQRGGQVGGEQSSGDAFSTAAAAADPALVAATGDANATAAAAASPAAAAAGTAAAEDGTGAAWGWWAALAHVGAHSLVPHKEERFLHLLLPLANAYAARATCALARHCLAADNKAQAAARVARAAGATFGSRPPVKLSAVRRLALAGAVSALASLGAGGYLLRVHQVGRKPRGGQNSFRKSREAPRAREKPKIERPSKHSK